MEGLLARMGWIEPNLHGAGAENDPEYVAFALKSVPVDQPNTQEQRPSR